jgi:hypothetical protein
VTRTPTITRTPTRTSALRGPRVSAFRPVLASGCPDCCEFSCRLTPTPEREFDEQGRPIYTLGSGRALIVVEGQLGPSAGQPGFEGVIIDQINGIVGTITHPSGRPSLQLLNKNKWGNGSSAVCDVGPVPPAGGVPGFDPPYIDCADLLEPELSLCLSRFAAVTNALKDVACRFIFVNSVGNACTRNKFGDFSYLNPANTTRQYCFQVPVSAELPVGDNVMAAQLRDQQGNLGPKQEIVVRVLPAN